MLISFCKLGVTEKFKSLGKVKKKVGVNRIMIFLLSEELIEVINIQ